MPSRAAFSWVSATFSAALSLSRCAFSCALRALVSALWSALMRRASFFAASLASSFALALMARASALRVARVLRRLNRLIPAASRSSRRRVMPVWQRWCSPTLSSGGLPIGVPRSRSSLSSTANRERVCATIVGPLNSGCRRLKGGDDVGSRVRVAAAACLVASGLFVGGAGASWPLPNPRLVATPVTSTPTMRRATAPPRSESDPDEKQTARPGRREAGRRETRYGYAGSERPDADELGRRRQDGDDGNGKSRDRQRTETRQQRATTKTATNPDNGDCGDSGRRDRQSRRWSGDDSRRSDDVPRRPDTSPTTKEPPRPPTTRHCDKRRRACSPVAMAVAVTSIPNQPPGAGAGGRDGGGVPRCRPAFSATPADAAAARSAADSGADQTDVVGAVPGLGVAAGQLPVAADHAAGHRRAPGPGLGGGGGARTRRAGVAGPTSPGHRRAAARGATAAGQRGQQRRHTCVRRTGSATPNICGLPGYRR